MIKRLTLILVICGITLSGCSNEENQYRTTVATKIGKNQDIKRLLSAKDIESNDPYKFIITDQIDEDYEDNYKLSSRLSITANDKQDYTLYVSNQEPDNIDDMVEYSFNQSFELTITNQTYFVLIGNDGPIDVTISTL